MGFENGVTSLITHRSNLIEQAHSGQIAFIDAFFQIVLEGIQFTGPLGSLKNGRGFSRQNLTNGIAGMSRHSRDRADGVSLPMEKFDIHVLI